MSNVKEIVIHVDKEPDYRFQTKKRKQLIDILKVLYLKNNNGQNENLPIYGVKDPTLIQYEKKINDIKKGVTSREPNDLMRLEEEDLIKMNLDEAIIELSDEDEDQV